MTLFNRYSCECRTGYAGNGIICGTDSDLDGIPDANLTCLDLSCWPDNCVNIPNSGQEDTDGDGIGDACDKDIDEDGLLNDEDNCPYVQNRDQSDVDDDKLGDICDICPTVYNPSQKDSNFDGIGDDCPRNHHEWDVADEDEDGIVNAKDNCVNIQNSDQADTDNDGQGDECDDDDDNDGVDDEEDDCPKIFNPEQMGCDFDRDADGSPDYRDICPDNPLINEPDFKGYETVLLDPHGSAQLDPYWVVLNNGKELIQSVNADPGLAIGKHNLQGVDYSGTVYINTDTDDDYVGFVFSYQNPSRFYAVMWKQESQTYWWPSPFRSVAKAGLVIKVVDSKTGPGPALRNALWHGKDTPGQVQILWQDEEAQGWEDFTAYRWKLQHRPEVGFIQVQIFNGDREIVNSGLIHVQLQSFIMTHII